MNFVFSKKEENKFKKGDIGFTRKDKEKVLVLKCLGFDEGNRNEDLGPLYLVRGEKQYSFRLYEYELLSLDEITQ